MPVGVFATWFPLPGREAEVEALLRTMRTYTMTEPGCVAYELHRLPTGFLLYEQYVDLAAIEAHHATSYYRELVAGRGPALVERREVVRAETI
ncbi:antibiotic biosynthesis monooxygenase [Solirubrobacter ginsenosidimutans]|uniref:Antibiotic biosynthesis monooxygenase n=1 Tax=Solirubrobacter ginsenosidimutans TaxID=490573 RepID=A0A9X3MQ70_9ACTN|nr:putative quinol monooxygenase [Solirubrobacter ginsenosidimutans]MDA0159230.1 antibiotic biosynthesis monooxygenase [Solirubrobacter ginsenosidimutans]